jgi:glycerol-3-phosphate acyltransferase PlsY
MPLEIFSIPSLLFALVCYIYGSIPFAYIFTYVFKQVKLTEKGTGNIGVANAFGVGGLKAGFLTVFGEATKAALPIIISHFLYSGELKVALILLTASILGISYSVFLKGRGGQGGTILLWGLLLLSPYTFLAFMAVFVVFFFILRNRYYTSIIGHVMLPLEIFLIEGDLAFVVFGAVMAVFYSVRYKPQASDYNFYKQRMRFLRFLDRKLREK